MSLDFVPWAQILRTPSNSSACLHFFPLSPSQASWARTQSHWLCFLHANLCLYPLSGFCLHCATETDKLLGDVFMPWLFQYYLFSFQYLTVLNSLHKILSSLGFQDKSHLEFFFCLFFMVFLGGGEQKRRLLLFFCCPAIVVLQDNFLIPFFLSAHFVYTIPDVNLSHSYILVTPKSFYISLIPLFYATLSFPLPVS